MSVVVFAFETNHGNKTFGKIANAIYCVRDPSQLTFQTRVSQKQYPSASPFLPHLCMRALHSKSVIKIVSRGRKAHPVRKVGDEDDGDDLALRCPIPFFVYLLLFLCSLGPLILSPILFYFFFLVPSLSVFFLFFSLFFHRVFLQHFLPVLASVY